MCKWAGTAQTRVIQGAPLITEGLLQEPLKHFSTIVTLKVAREETLAALEEVGFKCQGGNV